MNKIILVAISALVLATSCNKQEGTQWWDWRYTYATVTAVGDDSEGDIYFLTDSNKSFVIIDNKSGFNTRDLDAGDRVITGVTIEEEEYDSYDYAVVLHDIVRVVTGESTTITTAEENERIKDDKLSYISTEITLTEGHLNLLVGFDSHDADDVEFYLVDNQYQGALATEEEYLNLELRYNRASKDGATINRYERYLSFNVEEFKEVLEHKKGVKLRINTVKSGTTMVDVESTKLFPEDDIE